jgi:hypothetical protein
MKKILQWIEKNEFIVLTMLFVSILRIPSIYEPYWYGDEGIYLVLGQALRAGEVWYRDIHDNKPPLLYLIAAITGNVMWFRLFLLFWSLVTVWAVYTLIKRFVKNRWGVWLGTIGFAIFTTLPTMEGNIANAEIFMILPTVLGVLLLTRTKRTARDFFFGGILMASAFLFKVPALFDFVAIGFWLLFFGGIKIKKSKNWIKYLFLYALGFFVTVGLTFAYYFAVGAGKEYLIAAFAQNVGYLSSWSTGSMTKSGSSTQSGLLMRGVILLASLVALWLVNFKDESKAKLPLVWFVFALFGALLSERPYPHYLIQLVPAGALLIAYSFDKQKKTWILSLGMVIALLSASVLKYQFYFYPVTKYYQNFAEYIVGRKSLKDYRNSFDSRVDRNYKVAEYIRLRTTKDEKIFVWGDEPFIYALSKRLPVGKYTVAYHVIDFNGKKETIERIESEKPTYIVWPKTETREFDELLDVISSEYFMVNKIDDTLIYRLSAKR